MGICDRLRRPQICARTALDAALNGLVALYENLGKILGPAVAPPLLAMAISLRPAEGPGGDEPRALVCGAALVFLRLRQQTLGPRDAGRTRAAPPGRA